jgi:hypothetical protein
VRPPRCPIALAAALALAASGCGDSATTPSPTATATNPVASIPESSPPPADATQPGTGPVTTTTPTPTTPTTPDEQQVRVPATFTIVAAGLRPRTITVPPFLAVEISAIATDGYDHTLTIATDPPATLSVAAGKRASTRVRGQRAGRYHVKLDGSAAGALVVGGEVGP